MVVLAYRRRSPAGRVERRRVVRQGLQVVNQLARLLETREVRQIDIDVKHTIHVRLEAIVLLIDPVVGTAARPGVFQLERTVVPIDIAGAVEHPRRGDQLHIVVDHPTGAGIDLGDRAPEQHVNGGVAVRIHRKGAGLVVLPARARARPKRVVVDGRAPDAVVQPNLTVMRPRGLEPLAPAPHHHGLALELFPIGVLDVHFLLDVGAVGGLNVADADPPVGVGSAAPEHVGVRIGRGVPGPVARPADLHVVPADQLVSAGVQVGHARGDRIGIAADVVGLPAQGQEYRAVVRQAVQVRDQLAQGLETRKVGQIHIDVEHSVHTGLKPIAGAVHEICGGSARARVFQREARMGPVIVAAGIHQVVLTGRRSDHPEHGDAWHQCPR